MLPLPALPQGLVNQGFMPLYMKRRHQKFLMHTERVECATAQALDPAVYESAVLSALNRLRRGDVVEEMPPPTDEEEPLFKFLMAEIDKRHEAAAKIQRVFRAKLYARRLAQSRSRSGVSRQASAKQSQHGGDTDHDDDDDSHEGIHTDDDVTEEASSYLLSHTSAADLSPAEPLSPTVAEPRYLEGLVPGQRELREMRERQESERRVEAVLSMPHVVQLDLANSMLDHVSSLASRPTISAAVLASDSTTAEDASFHLAPQPDDHAGSYLLGTPSLTMPTPSTAARFADLSPMEKARRAMQAMLYSIPDSPGLGGKGGKGQGKKGRKKGRRGAEDEDSGEEGSGSRAGPSFDPALRSNMISSLMYQGQLGLMGELSIAGSMDEEGIAAAIKRRVADLVSHMSAEKRKEELAEELPQLLRIRELAEQAAQAVQVAEDKRAEIVMMLELEVQRIIAETAAVVVVKDPLAEHVGLAPAVDPATGAPVTHEDRKAWREKAKTEFEAAMQRLEEAREAARQRQLETQRLLGDSDDDVQEIPQFPALPVPTAPEPAPSTPSSPSKKGKKGKGKEAAKKGGKKGKEKKKAEVMKPEPTVKPTTPEGPNWSTKSGTLASPMPTSPSPKPRPLMPSLSPWEDEEEGGKNRPPALLVGDENLPQFMAPIHNFSPQRAPVVREHRRRRHRRSKLGEGEGDEGSESGSFTSDEEGEDEGDSGLLTPGMRSTTPGRPEDLEGAGPQCIALMPTPGPDPSSEAEAGHDAEGAGQTKPADAVVFQLDPNTGVWGEMGWQPNVLSAVLMGSGIGALRPRPPRPQVPAYGQFVQRPGAAGAGESRSKSGTAAGRRVASQGGSQPGQGDRHLVALPTLDPHGTSPPRDRDGVGRATRGPAVNRPLAPVAAVVPPPAPPVLPGAAVGQAAGGAHGVAHGPAAGIPTGSAERLPVYLHSGSGTPLTPTIGGGGLESAAAAKAFVRSNARQTPQGLALLAGGGSTPSHYSSPRTNPSTPFLGFPGHGYAHGSAPGTAMAPHQQQQVMVPMWLQEAGGSAPGAPYAHRAGLSESSGRPSPRTAGSHSGAQPLNPEGSWGIIRGPASPSQGHPQFHLTQEGSAGSRGASAGDDGSSSWVADRPYTTGVMVPDPEAWGDPDLAAEEVQGAIPVGFHANGSPLMGRPQGYPLSAPLPMVPAQSPQYPQQPALAQEGLPSAPWYQPGAIRKALASRKMGAADKAAAGLGTGALQGSPGTVIAGSSGVRLPRLKL